jgi:S-adenosylmethionine:tRNA ribosyltransferase-isomerase
VSITPFALPATHVATAPPEARGLERDGVRLLVADAHGLHHHVAHDLPALLRAGDLLVLNTSDTLPAAIGGVAVDGERVEVHLSTLDPGSGVSYPAALRGSLSRWVLEVRAATGPLGGEPSARDRAGAELRLTGGGVVRVDAGGPRLWTAELQTPRPLGAWLAEHGQPIRYAYTAAPWPLSAYRTPYADTPGSVEMPSAGRALTRRLRRALTARGVEVASLVLHTGVSSPEAGESPFAEWFEVPECTAAAVAAARREGRRVIAVGTTVVRALESALHDGEMRATAGWTELVVTPKRGVAVIDGLLTGWHEPAASHLQLLAAVADTELLDASYAEALRCGYRWHEFGDLHLILPS